MGPQALYQLYFLLIVSLNGMKYVVEGEVVEGEIKNFIGVSVWFVKIALFKQSSIRVTSNEAILSLTSNIKSSSRTLTYIVFVPGLVKLMMLVLFVLFVQFCGVNVIIISALLGILVNVILGSVLE